MVQRPRRLLKILTLIRRDFFMPPIQLTVEESLALALLADHVGGQEQVPYTKAAVRAIEGAL